MKLAKITVILIFISAFALAVSAQTSKIVWKNLQKNYEKYEDVRASIVNKGNKPIYFFPTSLGSDKRQMRLYRFDEKTNKWMGNDLWACGTGVKIRNLKPIKIKPNETKSLYVDGFYFDVEQGIFTSDVTEGIYYPEKGKYKFQINYGEDKANLNQISESPEFWILGNTK